jgi:hypothetical protein
LPDPDAYPGRCGGKPATKRVSYCAADVCGHTEGKYLYISVGSRDPHSSTI